MYAATVARMTTSTTNASPSARPGGTAADRVRALRIHRGLSQVALSVQAGVSLQTIGLLERLNFYTPTTKAKIAAALGIRVEELFE